MTVTSMYSQVTGAVFGLGTMYSLVAVVEYLTWAAASLAVV